MSATFNLSTKELIDAIGISETSLRKLRSIGCFKPGEHFIDIGTGDHRPTFRWCLAAVETALQNRTRRHKPRAA